MGGTRLLDLKPNEGRSGVFADFRCVVAILPNDLATTNLNGPKLPSVTLPDAAAQLRQTSHSSILQQSVGSLVGLWDKPEPVKRHERAAGSH